MKKLLAIVFIILFTVVCSGEEERCSYAGLSAGHSWFHDYSGYSKSGMNLSLFYEPSINRYLSIDNALFLHLNWKDSESETLFDTGKKDYYFMPQFTIGPRAGMQFFNRLGVFLGGGLSFSVGIQQLAGESGVSASFSPGFYLRTGFDVAVIRFLALGLEVKYDWSVVQIPHLLTFNFRISYRYMPKQQN